jgi:excisionase family DNA binding protein
MDYRPTNEWLSLSQVAEILGVHPSTVRSWSNQGSFPVHRTQGGHRRYLRSEVDLWLQSQRSGAASEHDLVVQKALKSTRLQISEGRLQEEKWYRKLDGEAREQYRQNSRTLLQGLISFLASGGETSDAEAHAIGYEYASRGRRFGLSVADSASAFLFFRNVLIDSMLSMYAAASVRSPDAWSGMFRKITSFTDQILLALLETYEALERGSNR